MVRLLFAFICVACVIPCSGQPAAGPELAAILNFEAQQSAGRPIGWGGSPDAAVADDEIRHSGKWAVRIENKTAHGFSTITKMLPMEFTGKQIQFRGFLRTEGVTGFVGLWMREDGNSPGLAFDNMQRRGLKGTNDWAEYSITLPVKTEARQLFFGVLVSGIGKIWADDLQLLVDGKPIWEAPKIERPKTVLDLDHEFDGGSKISLTSLTSVQTANLASLAKVWGFLKYHHPRVTSGKQHWDYDLFRVMPALLAAADREAANAALVKWIAAFGKVEPCKPCAEVSTDLHLRPELGWLDSVPALGLRAIHENRLPGKQFYVSLTPGVGNPVFENELSYGAIRLPDAGFQLLGLFRFWNIIEYWFPYRDVIGENWDDVLAEFIPRVALAKDAGAYASEMMALIARVHDTHANLWSSLGMRPPVGTCQLPVHMRFVENRAVVAAYASADAASTGLKVGDVIADLDGTPVSKLVETWKPYYAASNEPTIMRDIARNMTHGACGEAILRISRGSESLELKPARIPLAGLTPGNTHDRPGETFQMLPDQIAYLKLSSVKSDDAASYIDRAAGSKGLIIDIRNYPSEFMVFVLGSLLVGKETEFVRFTNGDLSNPGAFRWNPPLQLKPAKVQYSGKVIVLIDEVSQSQAEYTTMAFRSSPQAKVIGSTTAGADGNVSAIPLPGNLRSMISGIGVFYPDKKPTQRVGILPDIEVKPTIAGIRDGRDELIEEAVRQILTTSGGTPAMR